MARFWKSGVALRFPPQSKMPAVATRFASETFTVKSDYLNMRTRTTTLTMATLLGIALNSLNPHGLVAAIGQNFPPLRPPAVPLVAHDPYFSIWSPADTAPTSGRRWTASTSRR